MGLRIQQQTVQSAGYGRDRPLVTARSDLFPRWFQFPGQFLTLIFNPQLRILRALPTIWNQIVGKSGYPEDCLREDYDVITVHNLTQPTISTCNLEGDKCFRMLS